MEGNGKFIHENGDYYIGQFRNNLANGKGTEYDVFGVIIYEGDFVDDVRNGDGKLFYENGSYYIGGFKNGERDGDGEEFDKDGKMVRFVTYKNGEWVKSDEIEVSEGEEYGEEGAEEGAEGGCNWEEEGGEGEEPIGHNFC